MVPCGLLAVMAEGGEGRTDSAIALPAIATAGVTTPVVWAPAGLATASGGTFLARPRDIDGERPALKVLVVEHIHGLVCIIGGRIFDKGEPARFAGELIQHQVDCADDSCLGKIFLQVILQRLVREITNEEPRLVIHSIVFGR